MPFHRPLSGQVESVQVRSFSFVAEVQGQMGLSAAIVPAQIERARGHGAELEGELETWGTGTKLRVGKLGLLVSRELSPLAAPGRDPAAYCKSGCRVAAGTGHA